MTADQPSPLPLSCLPRADQFGTAGLSADVCVIGSGAAGAVAAVALARAGIDVVVLEAGGGESEAAHDARELFGTVDAGGAAHLRFGFSRQLGGASNLWAGRICPFEAGDLKGWPFAPETLAPYYRQAAAFFGVAHERFSHPDLHDWPRDFPGSGGLALKPFIWTDRPFRAADHLLQALTTTKALRVILDAPVARLIERGDGQGIAHAEVKKRDGGLLPVKAKIFIVAAGGVETPRLLLNSRVRRPQGLGNDHDQVGRYFSTHPKADLAALVTDRPVSIRHPLFSDSRRGRDLVRLGIGLDETARLQSGTLNHYFQLSPSYEYAGAQMFERVRESVFANYIPPVMGRAAFAVLGRVARLQGQARRFTLRCFFDQAPDPENRLTLSVDKDGRGVHKLDLRWRFGADDRADVLRFFAAADERLRKAGARLDYEACRAAGEWPLVAVHSHFMGATRMGADPRRAVTDGDGQVFDIHNLFIAGPSLFPTYGYANPFYTIAALSLKVAERVRKRLSEIPA